MSNLDKKERLKDLILELHNGKDEAEVKKEFKKEFGDVSSYEISQLEQTLITEGMPIEEVQRLCNVHAEVFTGNIEDLHVVDAIDSQMGHPLFIFRKENEGIRKFVNFELLPSLKSYNIEDSEENRIDLLSKIKSLSKVIKHYERKENLFFPYLEKAGVTGPSKVMWGKDDEIRALFKTILNDDLNREDLLKKVALLISEVESMIVKENDILSPLLIKNINSDQWLKIAEESPSIGFVFNDGIPGASTSDANYRLSQQERGLSPKIERKEDENALKEGIINLPTGNISINELRFMLNTAPSEFTFIDKDDKVLYFSESDEMIFPRVSTIIGRDVRNCHPPKALPVVEKMLEDFKLGNKDKEVRFLQRGNELIMIRYFAVRDEDSNYIGTLETVEEISDIIERADEFKKNKE